MLQRIKAQSDGLVSEAVDQHGPQVEERLILLNGVSGSEPLLLQLQRHRLQRHRLQPGELQAKAHWDTKCYAHARCISSHQGHQPHSPHPLPWLLTDVTLPLARQSTAVGMAPTIGGLLLVLMPAPALAFKLLLLPLMLTVPLLRATALADRPLLFPGNFIPMRSANSSCVRWEKAFRPRVLDALLSSSCFVLLPPSVLNLTCRLLCALMKARLWAKMGSRFSLSAGEKARLCSSAHASNADAIAGIGEDTASVPGE